VVTAALRSLWAEPRVADPPSHPGRDAALVAAVAPLAILEAVLGENRTWPVASVVVVVALAPTLFWRRTHPLAMVALAFGTFSALDIVAIVAGTPWEGLGAGAFVLVLLYSLTRWGSGRDVVVGLPIVMFPVVLGAVHDTPLSDVLGGGVLLLLIATIGASVRYQATAHTRGIQQVKLREREQLARELHDTVAHHVSAIAVQAQAGRAVAAARPEAALEVLATIEEEASRTLAEMRTLVAALRQDDEPELAPQRGVADIGRLAGTGGAERPRIDVELTGDLDGLWPAVDAALYRLAQESITNALRHARHATLVRVQVVGDDEAVRLTVTDDGESAAPAGAGAGYGLVGMAERAQLLGGTLDAGPDDRPAAGGGGTGGWAVRAVLPRAPRGGTAS
jgi:signal transduction histidine kinase